MQLALCFLGLDFKTNYYTLQHLSLHLLTAFQMTGWLLFMQIKLMFMLIY